MIAIYIMRFLEILLFDFIVSILIAFLFRKKFIPFWKVLVLGTFATPIIALIACMVADRKDDGMEWLLSQGKTIDEAEQIVFEGNIPQWYKRK